MICNVTVEVISGTTSADSWGDTSITEGAPIEVPGHIGDERDATDRDGLTLRRCYVRLGPLVVVGANTMFRINGVRWKPLSSRVSRNPQNHVTYNCQRVD